MTTYYVHDLFPAESVDVLSRHPQGTCEEICTCRVTTGDISRSAGCADPERPPVVTETNRSDAARAWCLAWIPYLVDQGNAHLAEMIAEAKRLDHAVDGPAVRRRRAADPTTSLSAALAWSGEVSDPLAEQAAAAWRRAADLDHELRRALRVLTAMDFDAACSTYRVLRMYLDPLTHGGDATGGAGPKIEP